MFLHRADDGGGSLSLLVIDDTGANLANNAWARFADLGGTVVPGNPWEVDLRVVYGDVNLSGVTDALDIPPLTSSFLTPPPALPLGYPFDVNGNGATDALDIPPLVANIGSLLIAAPTGHGCLP